MGWVCAGCAGSIADPHRVDGRGRKDKRKARGLSRPNNVAGTGKARDWANIRGADPLGATPPGSGATSIAGGTDPRANLSSLKPNPASVRRPRPSLGPRVMFVPTPPVGGTQETPELPPCPTCIGCWTNSASTQACVRGCGCGCCQGSGRGNGCGCGCACGWMCCDVVESVKLLLLAGCPSG